MIDCTILCVHNDALGLALFDITFHLCRCSLKVPDYLYMLVLTAHLTRFVRVVTTVIAIVAEGRRFDAFVAVCWTVLGKIRASR